VKPRQALTHVQLSLLPLVDSANVVDQVAGLSMANSDVQTHFLASIS
jgi:hypothetical protein